MSRTPCLIGVASQFLSVSSIAGFSAQSPWNPWPVLWSQCSVPTSELVREALIGTALHSQVDVSTARPFRIRVFLPVTLVCFSLYLCFLYICPCDVVIFLMEVAFVASSDGLLVATTVVGDGY